MDDKKLCPKCDEEKNVKEFYLKSSENKISSWCKVCVYKAQKNRWIDRKKKAIGLFGGKCSRCGYHKNYAAFDFHHVNPSEKEFDWRKLRLKKWESVVKELKKCCLLCKNCHAEVHNPGAALTDSKTDNNFLNIEITSTGRCPQCSSDVFGTTYCSVGCSSASRRKVKRPNRDELAKMIETSNYCAIARRYKVSDNAVRKWAKNYGLL
jgi:hypothetical protein